MAATQEPWKYPVVFRELLGPPWLITHRRILCTALSCSSNPPCLLRIALCTHASVKTPFWIFFLLNLQTSRLAQDLLIIQVLLTCPHLFLCSTSQHPPLSYRMYRMILFNYKRVERQQASTQLFLHPLFWLTPPLPSYSHLAPLPA